MADAGVSVSELFMLLRASDDRRVLEEIYNRGGGANWDRDWCTGWMTDAPLSEWYGVTADADDNVTALALYDNQITDEGMVALAAALPGSQITKLHLNENEITDAGATALAEALPGSQVKVLDLGNNQITDAGAAALAEALPGSQVTNLGLDGNQITGPWRQRIQQALHATS
jgi:hypothetical protein